MKTEQTLIIFSKIPRCGEVKSRLIPAYGARIAAAIYAAMLADTLLAAGTAANDTAARLEIHLSGGNPQQLSQQLSSYLADFCPNAAAIQLEQILQQAAYARQQGADLGERMYRALRSSNDRGCPALLIGCDCPDLDADYLCRAFTALKQHRQIITPTADGGYCLIGSNDALLQLFSGISWSTAGVMAQTLSRAQAAGIELFLLPQLHDIDTPPDLADPLPAGSLLARCLAHYQRTAD